MKWFKNESNYIHDDFYNYGIRNGLIYDNDHSECINLIEDMTKQVEDLKFIVETQQMLNDRMLKIMSEITDA